MRTAGGQARIFFKLRCCGIGSRVLTSRVCQAGVAQRVEQLICNQPVGGSNPFASSNPAWAAVCFWAHGKPVAAGRRGEIPERSKGADCKSAAVVLRRFESSSPHHHRDGAVGGRRLRRGSGGSRSLTPAGRGWRGSSSGVEHQPSKLRVAGSNPVSRSMASLQGPRGSVVEHFLGKEGVTGSIPVVGSTFRMTSARGCPWGWCRRAGADGPPPSGASRPGSCSREAAGGSRWRRRSFRGRSRT